jgi:hypothetical protein
VSRAALRSKPIIATTLDLSETQAGCAVASAVVMERPFLKPCYNRGRVSFAFMKASRSSLATVSRTFDMAQRMATGRYDACLFLAFPPL